MRCMGVRLPGQPLSYQCNKRTNFDPGGNQFRYYDTLLEDNNTSCRVHPLSMEVVSWNIDLNPSGSHPVFLCYTHA